MANFTKGPFVKDDDIFIGDFYWVGHSGAQLHYAAWLSKSLKEVVCNDDRGGDCRRIDIDKFFSYCFVEGFEKVAFPLVHNSLKTFADPSVSPNSR